MTDVATTTTTVARMDAATVANLMEAGIEKGITPEGLEKLVDLSLKVQAVQAAQAFADALAEFQRTCPLIAKNRTAKVLSNQGASFTYEYASLDHIAGVIQEPLHAVGLSYRWDSTTQDAMMTTVCTVTHRDGHSEASTFTCPVANPSKMNDQQKHASALSYGKRQSLTAALGITTTDPDTDGATDYGPVSEDQVVQLEDAYSGLHMSKAKFFEWLDMPKGSAFKDIPANRFEQAMNGLRTKRQEQEKAGGK